jgi:hypothetical protein
MRRAVSILQVADPSLWDRLAERIDVSAHTERVLDETRRIVRPSFSKVALPKLGEAVLVRYARRTRPNDAETHDDVSARIGGLPPAARAALHAAQRHALDGVVVGLHAWDPERDAPQVRALFGAGLLEDLDPDGIPYAGRYRLRDDLPPPPTVDSDFSEAVFPAPDDLGPASTGPAGILHDAASLAGALDHVSPKRTHKGPLSKTDVRKLGRRLGASDLADSGLLETHPRWGLALRALEALGAVSMDPLTRELHLDLGLDETLAGETTDAIDRFIHKVLDRDLHPLVPAIRRALQQAGDGAVDSVIFSDELRDQHRDVLFVAWRREGLDLYPLLPGERPRPYDDDMWERVEGRAIDRALRRFEAIGLVRQAPGVFAATDDGRQWAQAHDAPRPPIWVSSDLEVIVPPGAITAWERFQLERLGSCLSRDVTDRYRLERAGLRRWLQSHDLDEAIAMLQRRAPGLPPNVLDTLRAWDQSVRQVVLTRGVLLDVPG